MTAMDLTEWGRDPDDACPSCGSGGSFREHVDGEVQYTEERDGGGPFSHFVYHRELLLCSECYELLATRKVVPERDDVPSIDMSEVM